MLQYITMRKAFKVQDEYSAELNNEANAAVVVLNTQLRDQLKRDVDAKRTTMIAVERMSGLAHATLFQWYKKRFDILRVDLLYRLAYVLRVKLNIR